MCALFALPCSLRPPSVTKSAFKGQNKSLWADGSHLCFSAIPAVLCLGLGRESWELGESSVDPSLTPATGHPSIIPKASHPA